MIAYRFMVVAAALGTLLWTTPAPAKSCRRLCHTAIAQCVRDARAAAGCTGLTGAARRSCKQSLALAVRGCKASRGPIMRACAASPLRSVCSPSGAFLDGDVQ